jgi:hypothetical protein
MMPSQPGCGHAVRASMALNRVLMSNEQVLKFVPKEKAQNKVAQEDEAGQAIVTQMRTAADLAKGDCDRAMSLGP